MAEENEGLFKALREYWWVFALVVVAFVANWLVVRYGITTTSERGLFGDSFGGLNALFSGLAFAGLVIAILLQRQDLKLQSEALKQQTAEIKIQNEVLDLQRKELADTREVLGKQHEQFALQSATMQKQTFENTFFQLLSLHNEIINAMSYDITGLGVTTVTGRKCLRLLYDRELRGQYDAANSTRNGCDQLDLIQVSYSDFNDEFGSTIGHYFRNFHNTISFINKKDISDKSFYMTIIRGQLSSSEMGLLFYNCLYYTSITGNTDIKDLIEEYSLLESLPVMTLFNPREHEILYAPSAYGKQEKEAVAQPIPQH